MIFNTYIIKEGRVQEIDKGYMCMHVHMYVYAHTYFLAMSVEKT